MGIISISIETADNEWFVTTRTSVPTLGEALEIVQQATASEPAPAPETPAASKKRRKKPVESEDTDTALVAEIVKEHVRQDRQARELEQTNGTIPPEVLTMSTFSQVVRYLWERGDRDKEVILSKLEAWKAAPVLQRLGGDTNFAQRVEVALAVLNG